MIALPPDEHPPGWHRGDPVAVPEGSGAAVVGAIMDDADVLAGPPDDTSGEIGLDLSYDGLDGPWAEGPSCWWRTGPENVVRGGTAAAPPSIGHHFHAPAPLPTHVRPWLILDGPLPVGLEVTFPEAPAPSGVEEIPAPRAGLTLRQKTSTATAPTTSVTLSLTSTAVVSGDLIVVACSLYGTSTTASCADNQGNPAFATTVTSPNPQPNWGMIFHEQIGTGAPSGYQVTINFGAAKYTGVTVLDYAASGTVSADTTGTNSNTSNVFSASVPISPTAAGELIIMLVNTLASSGSDTPGSGFTVQGSNNNSAYAMYAAEDSTSQPAGAISASITFANATPWSGCAAAWAVAAAAAPSQAAALLPAM